jgi:hypothetical protein
MPKLAGELMAGAPATCSLTTARTSPELTPHLPCAQDTALLAQQQSRYWLGLSYSNDTYLYEWADGATDAGSGPPSEYPYAHFVYNFQDLKGTYPTWLCTGAWSGWTYNTWVGSA